MPTLILLLFYFATTLAHGEGGGHDFPVTEEDAAVIAPVTRPLENELPIPVKTPTPQKTQESARVPLLEIDYDETKASAIVRIPNPPSLYYALKNDPTYFKLLNEKLNGLGTHVLLEGLHQEAMAIRAEPVLHFR